MIWKDGGSYEGEWSSGMFTGKGTYISPSGIRNTGEWTDGWLKCDDGSSVSRYGVFFGAVDSLGPVEGYGKLIAWDGTEFEGQWSGIQFGGKGTITYPDGRKYAGEWGNIGNAVVCHGQGTMRYPNGTVYAGEWIDNVLSGEGTAEYSDGSIYTGEWRSNFPYGQGKIVGPNGVTYEGEWIGFVSEQDMPEEIRVENPLF